MLTPTCPWVSAAILLQIVPSSLLFHSLGYPLSILSRSLYYAILPANPFLLFLPYFPSPLFFTPGLSKGC